MNMTIVYYVISAAAIVVMAGNVVKAFRLKKSLAGGEVGEKWGYALYLIVFFFVGYIVSPLFLQISPESKDIVISFVFLFGAVFVFIMINLIFSIITLLDVKKGM
jgi:hypothetical protein